MDSRPDGKVEAADQALLPSAPPAEDEHTLGSLKMTQIRTNSSNEDNESPNEWTVVYSDSNSSVLSGADDDEDAVEEETIDISVVEEAFIEGDQENDTEDEDSSSDALERTADPDSKMTGDMDDGATQFQIWEQSVDSATGSWAKPILVGTLDTVDCATPSPSFADNEYESSDIDIINDEDEVPDADALLNDDRDSILSMSISSVISQTSNLSMLREQYLQAHLSKHSGLRRRLTYNFFANNGASSVPSDDEDASNQLIDTVPLSKISRIRAYVHTPNTVLNSKLNLILILSITAVVGLGIGHFIGWSNQWRQAKQLSMGQVIKLKQLQDDLLVCMKHQDMATDAELAGDEEHRYHKVCLHDSDYWKERFETLFSENKGLFDLFQKTQKHFRENGDHQVVINDHECTNKTTSEEFHKLKLDLLVNQMEHLKVLEALEEVKTKREQSEQLVKVLEEENHDLKKKLEEEEEDDQELEQTWGNRVALLQTENEELRQTLVEDDVEDMKVLGALRERIDSVSRENGELKLIIEQLEKQMAAGPSSQTQWSADFAESAAAGYVTRYNAMRDRINQMMSENEELKAKIARYRWTKRDSGGRGDKRRHGEEDEDEMEDSKRNLIKMRDQIDYLSRQLLGEQNESRKWKERFEAINKVMKRVQERDMRRRRRGDAMEDDHERKEGEKEDRDRRQRSRGSEEEPRKRKWASFRARWNRKFASFSAQSKKYLNNFVEKVKTRWDRLHRKVSKEFSNGTPLSGDKLVKIGSFFESAFENVHNFSEHLLQNSMRSEVVTYLADRMTEFANLLEKNLNLKQKWTAEETTGEKTGEKAEEATREETQHAEADDEEAADHFYRLYNRYHHQININQPDFDSDEDEDDHDDSEEEDVIKAYRQAKRDYPPPPPYPAMVNKGKRSAKGDKARQSWIEERAKAREKYRRMRLQTNFENN